MYYRNRKIDDSERAYLEAQRFHKLWDAGKRDEALAYRDTLDAAARRRIDDEAQRRSEVACRI